MAESFEGLDNILQDWAKGRIQKCLVEALNRYELQKEEHTDKPFLFYKMTQKKNSSTESQLAVERD